MVGTMPEIQLTDAEARVLGALIEKDMATPEYYPLSLNALVNACNQKSNREPVVQYDGDTVSRRLDSLQEKLLVREVSGERVVRFAHRAQEILNLNNRDLALVCVLLLRGPQTVGELKQRSERLHSFDGLDSIEACLRHLAERGFVSQLRSAGMREPRYTQLFTGEAPSAAEPERTVQPGADRIGRLETEVAAIRERMRQLEAEIERLRPPDPPRR